jgi:hypothetical protein
LVCGSVRPLRIRLPEPRVSDLRPDLSADQQLKRRAEELTRTGAMGLRPDARVDIGRRERRWRR